MGDGVAQIERGYATIAVPGCAARADRVLFLGGSFDPVHMGHVGLALSAARAWGGDEAWVVFVPAARSPHKDREPTADRHRLEMLRLALRGRRRWWIWDQELRDAGLNPGEPSYWADTWAIAKQTFGGGDGRAFLIGTDQALSMHRWRRSNEFWRDALVMRRGDGSDDDFAGALRGTGAWSEADIGHWMSRVVDVPVMDVSSTAIREGLSARENARGEGPVRQAVDGLDPGVFRYIAERGLYRDG